MNFRFPQCVATPLAQLVTTISKDGLKMMTDMLLWNPEKRPTAANSLKYKYFQVGQKLGAPIAIVQPQIAVKMPAQDPKSAIIDRKPSAESTQSDSKLVVRRAPNKAGNTVDDILGGNGAFKANNGAKTDRSAPVAAQKPPEKPKMERQFNRNISLTKSTNLFDKKIDMETSSLPAKPDKSMVGNDKNGRIISAQPKKSPMNAKELYLSKSRYVPGVHTQEHKSLDPSGLKNAFPQQQQRSSVQARFEYAYGYVPSFGAPFHMTKAQQQNPKPPSGRTDWSAKYGNKSM
uniref:Uncharacterized protein n=1 Tax=Plectus sambesii TaxID=2011161 RepID=A0A914V2K8_9BILA